MTATRSIEIDAGHRLLLHESKCAHPHGHRYRFEVTVAASALDAVGRVLDFGAIKEKVGGWLDAEWDHAFLVEKGDPLAEWLAANRCRHAVLSVPPTAENLAKIVFDKANDLLRSSAGGLRVVRVRCWETPNCWSDYEAGE